MQFEGTVYDPELLRRFNLGEELELSGAFSEGVYFTGPGGVVLIHDSRYGSLPFGIAVRNFSGSGRALGLTPGDKASLFPGGLRGIGHNFLVLVSPGDTGYSKPLQTSPEHLESLYSLCISVLSDSGRASLLPYCRPPTAKVQQAQLTDEFARAGLQPMLLLRHAIAEGCKEELPAALSGLLGLGRGLTPSFDDFFTGMLFTLGYSCRIWDLEPSIFHELSLEITRQACLRTNVFSAAYLLAAARGGDFSMLRECLEPLPAQQTLHKLHALLKIGGSSGADMLSGMAFALGCILTLKHLP